MSQSEEVVSGRIKKDGRKEIMKYEENTLKDFVLKD
jgi:hypothetical protein